MQINKLLQELKNRGLISKIAHEKELIQNLSSNHSFKIYCGFDPTADSLHVGHLLPMLCIKYFQIIKCIPIILIGGATSIIGDPSFKDKERRFNFKTETKNLWEKKITKQLITFFKIKNKKNTIKVLNNFNWINNINIIDFLSIIGKQFSVNKMIKKESVKQRITKSKSGISFTEFSYSLLQSYDFLWLFKNYKVILQIGGSDQWGNITSGIHLIKNLYKKNVSGITVPLLLQSNGKKFGKTEKETIWLNEKKTTPYKFYQFWLNTQDKYIINFLKLFTLINLHKINKIEEKFMYKKVVLKIKKILASYITRLIHGKHRLLSAQRITNYLFSDSFLEVFKTDFQQLKIDGIPSTLVSKETNLQKALLISKLSSSKRQSRYLIKNKSIRINKKLQKDIHYKFSKNDKIFNKYTILSKGKRNHCLLFWNK
ncbi:tyrosine--tRNA ligase [Buchnera aphidicola]|uniref:Tyrosine--tRNA ligase n=1 Tax=Buchnera aphidicola (Anoecia oenotherae) TaxID=1241833 RepID=A0A4D6XPN6_9GAMM|nr:tyrosine--tRNA ligase [Buchnera aphidicola]QCI19232.1 tyrosine--tRNA ligase [Buchnera aphidicola (Anoecia oenotherae)]